MKSPRLLQFAHDDPAAIRDELFGGFSASTAAIPPKYFYDALGSRLFSAITELPEYYPSRTDTALDEVARCAVAAGGKKGVEVFAAYEGLTVDLG